jgi:hypothetical protein
MLRWWFENLGEYMSFEGRTYPRYLLWHPRDHIHWSLARRAPDGGSGQGAYFRIVDAFAANPAYAIDSTEYVERLDTDGIALVRHIAGLEVFRLEHRFGETAHGARYNSRMRVGVASGPLRWPFNRLVRPRVFSDAMGAAWLTHNVEEVGSKPSVIFTRILSPYATHPYLAPRLARAQRAAGRVRWFTGRNAAGNAGTRRRDSVDGHTGPGCDRNRRQSDEHSAGGHVGRGNCDASKRNRSPRADTAARDRSAGTSNGHAGRVAIQRAAAGRHTGWISLSGSARCAGHADRLLGLSLTGLPSLRVND